MTSSTIYTKEKIFCIILIIVGFSLSLGHSNTINVSGNRNRKTNFNENNMLRDDANKHNADLIDKQKIDENKTRSSLSLLAAQNSNENDENSLHDYRIFDDDIDINYNDDSNDFESIEIDDQLSLKDQMRVLTKQMNKLMQNEWKVTMRKKAKELLEADFQSQLEQLR